MKIPKFEIIGPKVLIIPDKLESEKQLPSGLFIQNTLAVQNTNRGTVIGIGQDGANPTGTKWEKLRVSMFDRVVYPLQAGAAMKLDGVDCLLVYHQDLLGKVFDQEDPIKSLGITE